MCVCKYVYFLDYLDNADGFAWQVIRCIEQEREK